jgi:hypothetical protein
VGAGRAICRLETGHKDRASYVKFIRTAFIQSSKLLWNGASFSASLNDDPHEGLMVTYIAREGVPLPHVMN